MDNLLQMPSLAIPLSLQAEVRGLFDEARFYELMKDLRRAIQIYEIILSLDPNHLESLSRVGGIYCERGDITKAEERLTRALEIGPNHYLVHFNLGLLCLRESEKLNKAIAHFRVVLELKPAESVAHFNLGIALRRRGRLIEAYREFRIFWKANQGNEDGKEAKDEMFSIIASLKVRNPGPKFSVINQFLKNVGWE